MACRGCNHLKHTLIEWPDPNTRIVVPLFHPRRDQWTDHFAWSLDTTQMIGLTSVGRATIDALQLNREGLRNLRRVLVNDQNHPPEEISAGG